MATQNEKLAHIVKSAMLNSGATNEDMSELTGLSIGTIQRIKSGAAHEYDDDTLAKLAIGMGTNLHELKKLMEA